MDITNQINRQYLLDVQRALWVRQRRARRLPTAILVGALVTSAAVLMILEPDALSIGLFVTVVVVAYLQTSVPLRAYSTVMLREKRLLELIHADVVHWTLTEEGITRAYETKEERGERELRWDGVERVERHRGGFILLMGDARPVWLSSRELTEVEVDRLGELLTSSLGAEKVELTEATVW